MRNLINFFIRYHAAFLFVFLECIGFAILVANNNYHNIRFLSWTAEISGSFYDATNNFTEYIHLKEANDQLAAENAALKEQLRSSYNSNKSHFLPVADTNLALQFEYTPAKVIQSTVNKRNNYIIIDKGSENGIEKEMGVVSTLGLVGIVTEASSHYATVMPVIHSKSRISARLKKNNFFGIMSWNGLDPTIAQLSDIPTHVKIAEGDTVVSRGSSGIFPEGTPIGIIDSWIEDPSTGFYVIQIKLNNNFRSTFYVQVIKNIQQPEIDTLEVEQEELP